MSILKETCQKCGHTRILRTEKPLKCSKCGHVPDTRINKKRR